MFICRDASEQYLVSAYWESGELIVVIKEDQPDGRLQQKQVLSYSPEAANHLVSTLLESVFCCEEVELNETSSNALAAFILSERRRPRTSDLRITPEMWN